MYSLNHNYMSCSNNCKCENCRRLKAKLANTINTNDENSLAHSLASIVLSKVNNAKTIKHNKDSVNIELDED